MNNIRSVEYDGGNGEYNENRWAYILFSIVEILFIGYLFGLLTQWVFWQSLNMLIVGYLIWIGLLGFTPLLNRFLIIVPKNSGAVIENLFYTYEKPKDLNELTELRPTKALREVGPGIQGILLWEHVGWVIDLGKQIILGDKEITAYSKDDIQIKVKYRAILTPLRGFLVNLVRHDSDTVKNYFEGRFISKIIQMTSANYAQSFTDDNGNKVQSIFEKVDDLKTDFASLFGGEKKIHKSEKLLGTFTNDPQLEIDRSQAFQKAAEAKLMSANNAEAIKALMLDGKGLSAKQALIAILASQGLPTESLRDVSAEVVIKGLENAQVINVLGADTIAGAGKSGGSSGKKTN